MTALEPAIRRLDPAYVLRLAWSLGAPASLRPLGLPWTLPGLRVAEVAEGGSFSLEGAGWRDRMPLPGMTAQVAFRLGSRMATLAATVREVPVDPAPLLVLDWPLEAAQALAGEEVRAAAEGMRPLEARFRTDGEEEAGRVLHLGERLAELGLGPGPMLELHAVLEVEARLPAGAQLRFTTAVQRSEWIEGDAWPRRAKVRLDGLAPRDREALRRFLQLRRLAGPVSRELASA